MKVQVLDMIMGAGKSTSAIKTIQSNVDDFYCVVLPYLDEVDRYHESCNEVLPENNQLVEPSEEETSKGIDLLNIIENRVGSVVTTHSLLQKLRAEHLTAITLMPLRKDEKVLILDETIDLVTPAHTSHLTQSDLQADVEI